MQIYSEICAILRTEWYCDLTLQFNTYRIEHGLKFSSNYTENIIHRLRDSNHSLLPNCKLF